MRETTARILVDLMLRHLGEQNNILGPIQATAPEDFIEARTMIGQTMGSLCADALRPLFAEHPGLKPEGMG
jgi:hypothetical protein